MRKTLVITEGESNRCLLEALLRLGPATDIMAAGGRSAAISLARSFLLNGQNAALVAAADTLDPNRIESGRHFLRQSLEEVATRSQWQVFVMIPEMEALFFDHRAVLEALVGKSVAERDFIEGKFAPKKTLEHLLGGGGLLRAYEETLPQIDLAPLRQHSVIRDLQRFLDGVAQKVAA